MSDMKLIQRTLKSLREQREKIDAAIKSLEAITEEPQQLEMGTAQKRIRKTKKITHADIAVEILREHGKPMKTKAILETMLARGHKVAGALSLYPTLDRSDSLEKVAKGTWALPEWSDEIKQIKNESGSKAKLEAASG